MSPTNPFRRYPAVLARLPRVVRLYIFNCMIGFSLSALFTGLILWFDVAGIGHLVQAVPEGKLALLVFFMFNGIVFSGVQTGVVIMSMDYDNDDRDRGLPVLNSAPVPVIKPVIKPVPVPVRAEAPAKRPLAKNSPVKNPLHRKF